MDTNTPSIPTYRIFRDKHGIPQFSPKRGTQALTDALAYTFPTLSTELELMQAALRSFFDSERGSKFVFELPCNDLQVSLAKPKAQPSSPAANLKSWKLPLGTGRGRRGSRASSRASSVGRPSSRALSRVSSRADLTAPSTRPVTPAEGEGTLMTWVLASGVEVKGAKKQPYDPVKRRKVAENRGNVCEKHRASKTACDPEVCPRNKGYGKTTDETVRENVGGVGFGSLPTLKEIRTGDVSSKPSVTSIPPTEIPQLTNPLPEQESDLLWDTPSHPNLLTTSHSPFPTFVASSLHGSFFTPEFPTEQMQSSYSDEPSLCSTNTLGTGFEPDASFEGGLSQLPGYEMISEPMGEIPCDPMVDFESEWLPDGTVVGVEDGGGKAQDGQVEGKSCEDPFMGWASKRSSQMCHDYGWVLSHVETL